MARPLPEGWLDILRRHVPFFARLEPELRREFLDMLKAFVLEKEFIGAKGMEITDEVRVVIGAAAVRLVLHLDLSYYDRLTEIVVYPFDYTHDGDSAIFGEAHTWGTVVLSWPTVLAGLENPRDGHDTALHEFAHVLDIADGSFDGAPRLRASGDYRPWAEILGAHYTRLMESQKPERDVLRSYGATNPAEFFAVATEAFFEKSRQMKRDIPELYEQLLRFYGFDSASDGQDGVPSGLPIGRNSPCPCKSSRKYKRCCGKAR